MIHRLRIGLSSELIGGFELASDFPKVWEVAVNGELLSSAPPPGLRDIVGDPTLKRVEQVRVKTKLEMAVLWLSGPTRSRQLRMTTDLTRQFYQRDKKVRATLPLLGKKRRLIDNLSTASNRINCFGCCVLPGNVAGYLRKVKFALQPGQQVSLFMRQPKFHEQIKARISEEWPLISPASAARSNAVKC